MKHKCKDCDCCDVINLLCHPNDKDCHKEYKLDEKDLYTEERCDFFIRKDEAKVNDSI